MAAYQPLFFAAVARTDVAVGTVVGIGSAPMVAGFLGAVVRREWPERRWFVATALAILGCVLLASHGLDHDPGDLPGGGPGDGPGDRHSFAQGFAKGLAVDPLGVVLAVGAGTAYAMYAVCSKGLLERYAADGVTAVVFVLAALWLSPVLLFGDLRWLGNIRGLGAALHLGLVATAASYLLFSRGLALVPVGWAATLSLAEPATATVLGLVVLGERLEPAAWVGLAAVVVGLAVLVVPSGVRRWRRSVARPARA